MSGRDKKPKNIACPLYAPSLQDIERAKAKWTPIEALIGNEQRTNNIDQDIVSHFETRIPRQYGYPPDMQRPATEAVLKQAEMIANELAGKQNSDKVALHGLASWDGQNMPFVQAWIKGLNLLILPHRQVFTNRNGTK